MKIGVFGGSFNPIHNGHLIIAEYVKEMCLMDKILFVPVGIPYHRENDLLSFEDRLKMLELATNDNPDFEISTVEAGKSSYTYETFKSLQKIYPNAELYEIIGEDSLAYLHKWKNYKEMLKEVKFIVFKRTGFDVKAQQQSIKILNNPKIDISATLVRENINNGIGIRYLVPETVRQHILANGFYKEK